VTRTPATGRTATTLWTFLPVYDIGKVVTFKVIYLPS